MSTFHDRVLDYDELAYLDGARMGLWRNWAERNSLSAVDFVRFGLAKWRGRPVRLPAGYDEETDPLLVRLVHPPLMPYLMTPFADSPSDRTVRIPQVVGAFSLSLVLFASYGLLSRRPSPWGALGLTALVLWITRLLFASISTHGWMSVWVTALACALSLWLEDRSLRAGLAACLFLALALTTLEMGVFVLIGATLAVQSIPLIAGSRKSGRFHRDALLGLLVTAGFLAILWPGAWLKGSLAKSWAYHLYRLSAGRELSSAASRLPDNVAALLPLGAVALLAAHRFWKSDAKARTLQWPSIVIAVIYAAIVLPHLNVARYLLPGLAPLLVWAASSLDHAPPWRQRAAASVLLGTVIVSWSVSKPLPPDSPLKTDLSWLALHLRNADVLADNAAALRRYVTTARQVRPVTVSYDGDQLTMRQGGSYKPLSADSIRGKYVVIRKYRKGIPGEKTDIELLKACPALDRPTLFVFDCATTPR